MSSSYHRPLIPFKHFSILYTDDIRFYEIYKEGSLDSCSDLSILDKNGNSVYCYLALAGKYKILNRFLIENNINESDYKKILNFYALSGDYEGFLKIFLKISSIYSINSIKFSLMFVVNLAEAGNIEAVKELFNIFNFNSDRNEILNNFMKCGDVNKCIDMIKYFNKHIKNINDKEKIHELIKYFIKSGNLNDLFILIDNFVKLFDYHIMIDELFYDIIYDIELNTLDEISEFVKKYNKKYLTNHVLSIDNYLKLLDNLMYKDINISLIKEILLHLNNYLYKITHEFFTFVFRTDLLKLINVDIIIFNKKYNEYSYYINNNNYVDNYNEEMLISNYEYFIKNNIDDKAVKTIKKILKNKYNHVFESDFLDLKNVKNPNEDCPVCYEKLNIKAVITTNCDHVFHYECIKKCVKCPMCRTENYI